MTAQEMWELYSIQKNIHAEYDAWAFGVDADHLAAMVLNGTKTATTSLHLWYEQDAQPLPQPGQYSVILDSEEKAVCVIRTENVSVVPYTQVDESHAWKEGEGDRTLVYWRSAHERFFRDTLTQAGLSFDEQMMVVCEEFVLVYP